MDKFPGWLKDEKGIMPVGHILGWETARSDLVGLIRIRIAQNPNQVKHGGVALQLVLPPEQIELLVRDLNALLMTIPMPGSASKQ